MESPSGWSIDAASCSDQELVAIIKQLRGSKHLDVQLTAQRELVKRLKKKRGLTTQQIVDQLVFGRTKGNREEVAEEWAEALEITVQEFKRRAGGK